MRLAGLLLTFLPTLTVLLLAVIRFDTVNPVINSIFFKPGAAIPPVLAYLAYGFSTLLVLLFSMVPGLSLWVLGHLAQGVRRR